MTDSKPVRYLLWLKISVGALAVLGLGAATVSLSFYQQLVSLEDEQRRLATDLQALSRNGVQADGHSWTKLVRLRKDDRRDADGLRYDLLDVSDQAKLPSVAQPKGHGPTTL